ncbi:MAG: hypothetical protein J7L25_11100 [Deltaproteobacteria bacterium]|nr:hypothetical protein [Candidatus Tharpella aukensis]
MNYIGDAATASSKFGIWLDSSLISEIEAGPMDYIVLKYMHGALSFATVDVEKSSIIVKFPSGIGPFEPGDYIKISGLNDKSSPPNTGTKMTGFATDVNGLTTDEVTVDETSVTIDLAGLTVTNGDTITIDLGYEMTSGNDG